jgi:hypothetical protein
MRCNACALGQSPHLHLHLHLRLRQHQRQRQRQRLCLTLIQAMFCGQRHQITAASTGIPL